MKPTRIVMIKNPEGWMLARFVEQDAGAATGPVIAGSIRANWNPSWGEDPGRPEIVVANVNEVRRQQSAPEVTRRHSCPEGLPGPQDAFAVGLDRDIVTALISPQGYVGFQGPEVCSGPSTLPREITSHKVNGLNEAIVIHASDELTLGGAPKSYTVQLRSKKPSFDVSGEYKVGPDGTFATTSVLRFQDGPINEVGVNGWSTEALLAIVADRLGCFQAGPYACAENAHAVLHTLAAMNVLHDRTKARAARGVEGTSQK